MAVAEPIAAPVPVLVEIKKIKPAPWNPASRISERRLSALRISIDDLQRMLYPILIDDGYNLIDGHRRLAVAKSQGWKRIACIMVNGSLEHSYGSVQLTQQKLTGNDILGVFLSRPSALIGKQRGRCLRVVKKLGKWAVEMLYKAGMSDTILRTAERAHSYLAKNGYKFELETVFRWIVKHNMPTVHMLIKGGYPAKMLAANIKADKPIVLE